MPRIPSDVLGAVFYLYKTAEAADAAEDFGGTGFVVGVPSEAHPKDHIYLYGITNWHVAMRDGFSVPRLRRLDGRHDALAFDPADWEKHPMGHDIAAIPLSLNPAEHVVGCVNISMFADSPGQREIGLGDDVYMVGRFVGHDGGTTTQPSVRFGNISVMPMPVLQPTGKRLNSYCIDLHSRPGYSGSPVFVYRTPFNNLDAAFKGEPEPGFLYFLGVHWGQFPERLEVEGELRTRESHTEAAFEREMAYYAKGQSGMTLVVPCQHVRELLYLPRFLTHRSDGDKLLAEELGNRIAPA